ncbi:hypothetical protein P691DRAFT_502006 [Macrolepiota fuliginosa MF-IS2]|uniref:C2H2-type domain-containing protein n=1 Tax=Macrolepiota fuliginosa MF-IS2 TaxID=1400762 RepID=A0A9P6C5R3_9AGAR|nr:hypothetical protein P691DRAFT_502006 [Macrolepiota fuliginosa MF-IS2]
MHRLIPLSQFTLENHHNADSYWARASHGSQMGYSGMRTYNESENHMKDSIERGKGNRYHVSPAPSFDPRSPTSTYCGNLVQDTHRYPPGINTNIAYRAGADLSPLLLSPSPVPGSGQFYSGSYGGSTPSLLSSTSSPPTGRSSNIPLTPGSGFLPGSQLPVTPDQFDQTGGQSPMIHRTGASPELGDLKLLDDYAFQMIPTVKAQCSQGPSVLLGSTAGSENSQLTDLDPLDDTFTGLEQLHGQSSVVEPVANFHDRYNIAIEADASGVHSVPITAFDTSTLNSDRNLLSPLGQLQALPVDEGSSVHYQRQMQGVFFQRAGWGASQDPGILDTCSFEIDNRRPVLASPLPFTFREGGGQRQAGFERFHSSRNTTAESVHDVLQDISTGQREVVNPKGVSERTLAAAEANRKREARFRCDVCGNSQTSKQNLENHIMSRHMQLKRFICPVENCYAKYGHARGVNRHLDSKHPGFRQPSSKGKRGPSKHM